MKKKSQKPILIISALVGVVLLITMIGTYALANWFSKIDNSDLVPAEASAADYFRTSYPQVADVTPLAYATLEEILFLTNPDNRASGIILFAFPECPWCQKAIPELTQAATTNDVDQILYFNITEIRANDTPEYQEIVGYLANYLESGEDGQPRIFVPHVFFIKNGQVQNHHLGTIESDTQAQEPLTGTQQEELRSIYGAMMQALKTD